MTMSLQDKIYVISSNGIPAGVCFFLTIACCLNSLLSTLKVFCVAKDLFATANLLNSEGGKK